MIKINNIKKIYNDTTVLNITDLIIPEHQCFGLVGNNGAGKTTFFSLLLDLIQPTEGEITNRDFIVKSSEDWKTFTSAFLDESFLISYLTAEEYFYFIGELRGQNKAQTDEFIQQFEELFNGEILNQKKYIRDMSKGNQKKVGIIGALIGNPEVIILDEPFANLDPTTQFRLKTMLKDLVSNGNQTVLISSHDLKHTTDVCERIVLLEKGEILKDLNTNPKTLKELEDFFSGISETVVREEEITTKNQATD